MTPDQLQRLILLVAAVAGGAAVFVLLWGLQ
jgi:hypothetical protein